MTIATTTPIRARVDALDWNALREQLDTEGHVISVPLLDAAECVALSELFDGGRFRSTIDSTTPGDQRPGPTGRAHEDALGVTCP